jgi:hypothetical protein
MNPVALRYLVIILGLVGLSLVFSWVFDRDRVQRVKEIISWLLKISYFDFVKLIIFIKPLKNYSEQVGIVLWLVLVMITGRYLIVTQPKITEIAGPYIPMIGYIFYLSVLFIIQFVLWFSRRAD